MEELVVEVKRLNIVMFKGYVTHLFINLPFQWHPTGL